MPVPGLESQYPIIHVGPTAPYDAWSNVLWVDTSAGSNKGKVLHDGDWLLFGSDHLADLTDFSNLALLDTGLSTGNTFKQPVRIELPVVGGLAIVSQAAPTSGGGAVVAYQQNDGVTVTPAGTRLGAFFFSAWDGVQVASTAAQTVFAEALWTSTTRPTQLRWETTGTTGGRTLRMVLAGSGFLGLGGTVAHTPAALLHLALNNSVSGSLSDVAIYERMAASGTASADYGGQNLYKLRTNQNSRLAAYDWWAWEVATEASRRAWRAWGVYDWNNVQREGIRIGSDGTQPLLGFYGLATPVARPTISGSRGANAGLAALLAALDSQNLIDDTTTEGQNQPAFASTAKWS